MKIAFNINSGENPRQYDGLVKCAINTKLWHGDLRPHQCPQLVCETSSSVKTLSDLCSCLSWDTEVEIADCFCDFVFWTGDGKPKIATHDELCEGECCDLGISCPEVPPIVDPLPPEEPPESSQSFRDCYNEATQECQSIKDEADALRADLSEFLEESKCSGANCEDINIQALFDKRTAYDNKLSSYHACLLCRKTEIEACERECCGEAIEQNEPCRYYVYRYINKYGQPSAPSPVAGAYNTDGIVTIPPTNDPCIVSGELFSLIAGEKIGDKDVTPNSGFMSIGVYPLNEPINTSNADIGFELDSHDYYPPPEDLRGISCHNQGLVGFSKNFIHGSVSNQPHAWNKKLCLDHEIKAIKVWNNIVYAFTTSSLYAIPIRTIEGGYTFGEPYTFGDKQLPLVGDQRSISSGYSGIFYPSIMGGVLVSGESARIITGFMAKDDWLSLDPKTMKTEMFDYGVAMFSCAGSYMLEYGDGLQEVDARLYQLPFKPDATFVDRNGILTYSVEGKIYKWDNCYDVKAPCSDEIINDCCCEYNWLSSSQSIKRRAKFTAGEIEFVGGTGDVKLEIYENDCYSKKVFEKTFNTETKDCNRNMCNHKFFRIPKCYLRDSVAIRLTGCAHVKGVSIATSRSSLYAN